MAVFHLGWVSVLRWADSRRLRKKNNPQVVGLEKVIGCNLGRWWESDRPPLWCCVRWAPSQDRHWGYTLSCRGRWVHDHQETQQVTLKPKYGMLTKGEHTHGMFSKIFQVDKWVTTSWLDFFGESLIITLISNTHEGLVSDSHQAKFFRWITSRWPHKNAMKLKLLLSPFCRQENWCLERLSRPLKNSQPFTDSVFSSSYTLFLCSSSQQNSERLICTHHTLISEGWQINLPNEPQC